MSDITIQEPQNVSWKAKVIIVGGLLGTLVGVASAYLLIQNREEEESLQVTPGEGVKLGVLVLGLLRSIATLGEGK
ncbi:MAG: hypothetical protein A2Z16_07530 [Chloroflexi bacterium RBG_16_54_18]|nr:MAG: hypothetical protein A2Z16_07530 [Chloroflexi bacterium RBG_16_54_18]